MICLNQSKNRIAILIVTIVSILILSMLIMLAYMSFTMKNVPFWFLLFTIGLGLAMFLLNTFFVQGPINLLLSQINKDRLYVSNNGIQFKAGRFVRTLPKKEVGVIVLQQEVLTIYTTNGDIFAQAECTTHQHAKKSAKQFGYQFMTNDPGEYIAVEQAPISHSLKSEVYYRNALYQNIGHMRNYDIKASNLYLNRNGVIYQDANDGPKVRLARHLLFSKPDEHFAYQKGKFSLMHIHIIITVICILIGLELLYYFIWGRIGYRPHINQTAVILGYFIYPVVIFISIALAYKWLRPKKNFEVTKDYLFVKHNKREHYFKYNDIQRIKIDHHRMTIITNNNTLTMHTPETYSLYYDLEEYQYPFEVVNHSQDKIKWYPGIKVLSPEANGWAKVYFNLNQDDESVNYSLSFVQKMHEKLKTYGITVMTELPLQKGLYINKGERNDRDVYF